MFEAVRFKNFRVLRDTKLPLAPFTLIVGPNGSGKTTALQALQAVAHPSSYQWGRIATAGLRTKETVDLVLEWGPPYESVVTRVQWSSTGYSPATHGDRKGKNLSREFQQTLTQRLEGTQIYSLDASVISRQVQLEPNIELSSNGANLAGVLDRLRDLEPERFEGLNEELGRWLPEFDQILFETPSTGARAVLLRTRGDHHKIQAADLSQGTLLALAILTLAYLPDPPPVACFEEPDRGIHPRLLRDVRDALYRLSYPGSFGEKREPVQVVATTHSPYFLDLFRDHPEEIVIAKRDGPHAHFERLSDLPDLRELLTDAHLGDVWYSGILGGVPSDR